MYLTLQTILLWALISISAGSFMVLFGLRKKMSDSKLAKSLSALAALVAVLLLVVRILDTKSLPLASGLDFGFWFNAVILLLLLFMTLKHHLALAGVIVYPLVLGLTGWMATLNLSHQPKTPALKSYWLEFHVSSAVIAYGAFCLAFVLSVLVMVARRNGKLKSHLPSRELLNEWSYRAVLVGMPFQTIMLITGAIWAEYAWGTYWNWDPKETWALITWLIYAAYLHLRLQGWNEKQMFFINLLGFAAILFTFFGVSYLLPGLHSYL